MDEDSSLSIPHVKVMEYNAWVYIINEIHKKIKMGKYIYLYIKKNIWA